MVELLRKAIEWQALLESGRIANQPEIARQEGITRARVTQVMGRPEYQLSRIRQVGVMLLLARRPLPTRISTVS